MRIAMVAPLIEPVPPPLYGGTERVVSVLTEELVSRGHDLTLFASGDSKTAERLVPVCPRGLRLDPDVRDYVAPAIIEQALVAERADEFDVIHSHADYVGFAFARLSPTPTLTTVHGRLDLPEVRQVYRAFPEHPLIAISEAQRASLPGVNWHAVVPNGIDLPNYRFRPDPGDYLVFLGRIAPEKRPDRAIEIARDVGMRLIIAAKIDPVDADYYEHAIAPIIAANRDLIEFVGEVDERGKDALLGGAYAYLFPIDWPEPFGLTMAEAMATGTPVVASNVGSVPEVVEDGVTGFVCDGVSDMVAAVNRVGTLDRAACRAQAERCCSSTVMATGYERMYAALTGRRWGRVPSPEDKPIAVVSGRSYRIEFSPRDRHLGEAQILTTIEGVNGTVTLLEPYVQQFLDQRRSGELRLVDLKSNNCVACRPVWPPGEDPLPEWVAWQQYTLLPVL